MKTKKILVTGGAGFIGSATVEALVERGFYVRILDNFSTGFYSNLRGSVKEIEVVEGDIENYEDCEKACKGVRAIIHLAAAISVPESIENPMKYHRVNTQGSLNVFLAAKAEGIQRIVSASTAAVYGDTPELPISENVELRPLSMYAGSKLAQENYATVFNQAYGMSIVTLRYFNIYGPRQDPKSPYAAAIPIFVNQAINGQPLRIFGDGEQTRCFVFVSDVANVNLLALEMDSRKYKGPMNVGHSNKISILDVAKEIMKVSTRTVEMKFEPERKGDIKHSYPDVRKIRDILGWFPEATFEIGLRKTFEWLSALKKPQS